MVLRAAVFCCPVQNRALADRRVVNVLVEDPCTAVVLAEPLLRPPSAHQLGRNNENPNGRTVTVTTEAEFHLFCIIHTISVSVCRLLPWLN